jgi:hypothetical protein
MQPDAQEVDRRETDWRAADCGSRNTVFEESIRTTETVVLISRVEK